MRGDRAPGRHFSIVALLCVIALIGIPVRAQQGGQGGQPAQAAPANQRPRREALPTQAEMAGKTAGQVYKNLKVLQDVPADKLIDGMRYITIALGERCEYCHVEDNFPSDQKRNKVTARKMMTMLFAIDKENFRGRTQVSCYTCHGGHHEPLPAPMPADTAAAPQAAALVMARAKPFQPPAGTPIPTVAQILAKYADALGGNAALAKLSTRVLEVERSGDGDRPPSTVQVYLKAPNKLLMVTQMRQRSFDSGYDGSKVWASFGRRVREVEGMEALLPPREAQIDPVASLQSYKGLRLVPTMAQIGDKKAFVVSGRAPDGNAERFFFDVDSGLLLRRMVVYPTIFGRLLFQADYSGYRKAGGVAIPYKTEWWAGGRSWTDTVKSVKTNVPVADARFEPPAESAQPAPANRR
jgi:hypothetical protein